MPRARRRVKKPISHPSGPQRRQEGDARQRVAAALRCHARDEDVRRRPAAVSTAHSRALPCRRPFFSRVDVGADVGVSGL